MMRLNQLTQEVVNQMARQQTTQDYRIANLRNLIQTWGGPLPLSRKLGYQNASYLVQMAGPNPSRPISEKTARAIETKLDLATNWLDQPPPSIAELERVSSANNRHANSIEHEGKSDGSADVLLKIIIQMVLEAAKRSDVVLSQNKVTDFANIVYQDTLSAKRIRPEFVEQIMRLIK